MIEQNSTKNKRRRDLIPLWIKIFVWFFMFAGIIVPIVFIRGALGFSASLSIYGLETSFPLSIIGIIISSIFLFKGVIAFGLWLEKDWAPNLSLIDAILGIIICLLVMLNLDFITSLNGPSGFLRLELAFLIPYLIKIQKIKANWTKLKTK